MGAGVAGAGRGAALLRLKSAAPPNPRLILAGVRCCCAPDLLRPIR